MTVTPDPHSAKGPRHIWRFFRAGGFDQVRLDCGADLAALDQLDQKLWAALSCPTRGLEFDTKTLDLIDTDHDGRVRAPEILAATRWACAALKDPGDLIKSAPALPLAAINDATPEGAILLASAKQILINLGHADATEISIEDTTDTVKIFAQTRFNGDGIIPADAGDDPALAAVIQEIIDCLGPVTDRSGKPGINQAKVDDFFTQAQAYADWWSAAEQGPDQVLPLGPATLPAAAALEAVRAKVDDYFTRCRLAAFDPRALTAANRPETDYLALTAQNLSASAAELAGFPLSRIEAGRALPLDQGVNPAWSAALTELRRLVAAPLLGDSPTLTEDQWQEILAHFAAYARWLAQKPAGQVEKLGLPRIRAILAGTTRGQLTELIARDQALEAQANAIAAVDKLIRLHRDLFILLHNFVSFRAFYSRRHKALFQAGTLYLDQRSCDLCVRVDDTNRHAAVALRSYTYLAYCDLVRKATGATMTIAAAFTAGDSDNLLVGRNGIFYDRNGQDWDATIVRIVEQPISIRQGFWAPYKRVIRWVEEALAKRASTADAAASQQLNAAADTVVTSVATGEAPPPPPPPPPRAKFDVGVIAAMGVALGAITTAFGMVLQAYAHVPAYVSLPCVVLLISGPSMLIAWLKLRQRNLGPLLDANGWAINTKAKINIPFGAALTATAALPPGARRDRHDPWAPSQSGRNNLIAAAIVLFLAWAIWELGPLDKLLPDWVPRSEWSLAHHPAALAAPTSLAAKPIGGNEIVLTWTAPPGMVRGYHIYRGTSAEGEGTTPLNGTRPVNTPSYVDKTALPGTQYFYTVKAVNASGPSPASTEVSATTPPAQPTTQPVK
jgi:hypothetical protein